MMSAPRIPNIGPVGIRRRRLLGLAAAAVGVAAVVALVVFGVPRPFRLVAFVPFWLGALGWLQAREKT
jgi:uncharacterized membrane protein YccC